MAHNRLAQQPLYIQTPKLCRIVVSTPLFFLCEKGKRPLEITKWRYKTWVEWMKDCCGQSLIVQLAQYRIWSFQFLQALARTKAWSLLFHPSSYHLKHSCCGHSGLLHHGCYCHGLAGWIQPLYCRFCSALWSFDSSVFKGLFRVWILDIRISKYAPRKLSPDMWSLQIAAVLSSCWQGMRNHTIWISPKSWALL